MATRIYGVPDWKVRAIIKDHENGKYESVMKQLVKLEKRYPHSVPIMMQILSGKTIAPEVESSDTFEESSLRPALCLRDHAIPVNMHGGSSEVASHGTTAFGIKNVQESVLVADGRCGNYDKVDKTRIYGKVAAVVTGISADYNLVDKRLKTLRRTLLRDGTEGTAQRFAQEAWDVLRLRPVRVEESEKAVILFTSVDHGVPSLWTATRETYDEVHGDYIAEGSGGYMVENFLNDQNYVSTWAMRKTIAVAKRAVVHAMNDPNTGGIVRIVRVTSDGAQVIEKVLADELVMLEEEGLIM